MENKKFIVIIVILVILLLASLGFIGYDKFLKKQDETIKTVINGVEMDLNLFYKIGDTLDSLDTAFNDTTNKYFGYIYGDKNLMIEKMNPQIALYASLYGEIEKNGTTQIISGNKVKSNLNNMFGKYVAYKADEVQLKDELYIKYSKEDDSYSHAMPAKNTIKDPRFYAIEVSTAVGEEEIIVKRKVFYVEFDLNEAGNKRVRASIYTNKDKKNLVTTMNLRNGVLNEDEVIAKYSSKLNTYIYTFKEYKNNEYVLYSIEKVRR